MKVGLKLSIAETEIKKFEINKSVLEEKCKLKELEEVIKKESNKQKTFPEKISFKKRDSKLFLLLDWKEILIKDEKLKKSIEAIHNKLNSLKDQVEDNPSLPKTEVSGKYVKMKLNTYKLETLLWLYKKLKNSNIDNNLKNSIENELFSRAEKNSFQGKKELLNQLKFSLLEKTDLYEKIVFTILKNLKNKQEGDKLISIVWKKEIQKAVKEQVIIDDKFAENFWFYFHTSDKTRWYAIKCESPDKVACNAFVAYLFAMKDQTKISNLNVLWYTLYKAFNGKLTEFKTWVLESINKYKEVKWKFPDDTSKIIQKVWLVGLVNEKIDEVLDKTNMSEWQKESWKWLWEVAWWIWIIIWIFKLIKKTWFKWLLGLILWGTALEFWAQATEWKSFFMDLVPKLLGGWLAHSEVEKATKNWIDFAKYNKEYAEQISKLSFLNMILWDKKLSDLKDYIEEKDWKISCFDTKKYIAHLDKNDWRIQIIKWMWEKNFSLLVVGWLSTMWIKYKKDLDDRKINTIFAEYQEKVRKRKEMNNKTSKSKIDKKATYWAGTENIPQTPLTGGMLWKNNKTKKLERQETNNKKLGGTNTSGKNWEKQKVIENWKKPKTELNSIKNTKIKEISELHKNEIANYFIDFDEENKESYKNELLDLDKKLKKNGLNLDIYSFLDSYKQYIETNLRWLKPMYLNKIKKSILFRVLQLSRIVDERILFVDKQIEKWNYKRWDRRKEIQNQRWIINQKMQDYFSFVNSELLPSVAMLLRYWKKYLHKKISMREESLYNVSDKLKEINKMLDSEVLPNWNFDKTIWSLEIFDAYTNHWDIFDISRTTATFTERWIDRDLFKLDRIKTVKWVSLLSEKDKKIEQDAITYYMLAVAAQITIEVWPAVAGSIFPGVWTAVWALVWDVAWWVVNVADLFSNTEVLLDWLQDAWLVDPNYRMGKTLIDNILAWIWLLPWMTPLLKWEKVAKFLSKLPKAELDKWLKKVINILKSKISWKKISKVEKWLSKPKWDAIKLHEKINKRWLNEINKKMIDLWNELQKRSELNKYYDNFFRKQKIWEIEKDIDPIISKDDWLTNLEHSKYKDFLKRKNINKILDEIERKEQQLKNIPKQSPIFDPKSNKNFDNTEKINELKNDISKLKEQLSGKLARKSFYEERENLKKSLNVSSGKDNDNKIKYIQKQIRDLVNKRQSLEKAISTDTKKISNNWKDIEKYLSKNLDSFIKDLKVNNEKIEFEGKWTLYYSNKTFSFKDSEWNIRVFKDEKDLKDFLESDENLKTDILSRNFEKQVQSWLFKKEIPWTDYLKWWEFEYDNKHYVIAKKGEDDKAKFYVIEKEKNVYKTSKPQNLDDFLSENPNFISNMMTRWFEDIIEQKWLWNKNIIPEWAKIPDFMKKYNIKKSFTWKDMIEFLKKHSEIWKALSSDHKFKSAFKLALTWFADWPKKRRQRIFVSAIWGISIYNTTQDVENGKSWIELSENALKLMLWNTFTTVMAVVEGWNYVAKKEFKDNSASMVDSTPL